MNRGDSLKESNTGGHGGNVFSAAEEFALDPEKICDFSSNINPLGPPPGLTEKLKSHISIIKNYPLPHACRLRRSLAEKWNLAEDCLLVGNGANELIHLLFLWLRPRKVLLPAPTFSEYQKAAGLIGCRVLRFPLPPGSQLGVKGLTNLLAQVDMLVLCNPNNPTGAYYPEELLENVIWEAEKRSVTVLIDESFLPFTGESKENRPRKNYPHLWTVTSLTKIWALPGLRLGYITGPPEKIHSLTKNGDPWRVNMLAQLAGLYCLEDNEYLKRSIKLIKRERDFLLRQLRSIKNLKVFEGRANYLLLKCNEPGFSLTNFYRSLASRGILVRKADNFAGLDRTYFRIAVRTRRENILLCEEIRKYFTRK